MRIFVAGASGVVGRALVPLLVAAGHDVTGLTRSPEKRELLAGLGAEPVVCDVYDEPELQAAVAAARPELVVHELTDLPDVFDERALEANARIRRDGTANLVAAALAAGASRLVAQSTAFPTGPSTEQHERLVLSTPGLDGVVLRYGRLYGPDTYSYPGLPEPPRVSVDRAAAETVRLLDAAPGIYEVVEPEP